MIINHYPSAYSLLLHLVLFSLFTQIAFGTGQTSNSTAIHGGGTTSIGCPDGSTVDTAVSFVAQKLANGTIIGNWTIDSIEDTGALMNGFSHGPIYQETYPWSNSIFREKPITNKRKLIYVLLLCLRPFL